MVKARRLRVKVAPRAKQRSRRNHYVLAFVLFALCGAAALATLRHMAHEFGNPLALFRPSNLPAVLAVRVVAEPESVREAAELVLKTYPTQGVAAKAATLRDQLPCVKSVTIRRDWLRRTADLVVVPRVAVAPATIQGKPAGFLSDDGVVFDGPEGAFQADPPVVEAAGASAADLRVAVALLGALRKAGALPSPLRSLSFASPQDGWQVRLEDGTQVLWGDGRWTADKLARLREVLDDAKTRGQAGGPFSADLRYFEDGRMLLRPLPPHALSMR